MTTTTETREQLIERVRKVLAYTNSPNQHEAQVAAEKVQELLVKYELELDDLYQEERKGQAGIEIVKKTYQYSKTRYSPLKQWKEILGMNLARWLNCRIYKTEVDLHFVGTEYNVDGVIELMTWLHQQLEVMAAPAWKEYVRELERDDRLWAKDDPLVFRANFFEQAVTVINDRMRQKQKTLEEADGRVTSIAIRHKEAIDEWLNQNVRLGKSQSRRRSAWNQSARDKGTAAGMRANLGGNAQLT